MDRFQTNNRLICPHGLLYNADSLIQTLILVQSSVFINRLRAVLRYMHMLFIDRLRAMLRYMHMLMSKYQQSKYTATDSNNLKCHALLTELHLPLETTSILSPTNQVHPSSFPLITRRDNE